MANSANRQQIRDLFDLGCGLLGIWELLRAADYAMSAFDIISGFYRSREITFAGNMVHAIGLFFLGLALLGSGTKLAAFWFPDTPNDKVPDEKDSDPNRTTI